MTSGNDRFKRNQDGTTTTRTGEDLPDDDFAAFSVWVNEPVSAYAKHDVPEDLREAIHDADDPAERQRLRAVVEAYERSELSPRDFVRLIVESDHIDYFDPLSTPEGWGSKPEEWHAPRRSEGGIVEGDGLAFVHEGETVVPKPEYFEVGDVCPSCYGGELIKGVDGDPLEPDEPWCEACGYVVGDPIHDEPVEPPTGYPWVEAALVVGTLVALIVVVVFVI